MRKIILSGVAGVFLLVASLVSAASGDIVVNGVNLGQCKTYSDGCNTCSVGDNGAAACTMRACFAAGTPKCLDTVTTTGSTDTSLTDLENNKNLPELKTDFRLQKFSSCTNMEDVMRKFIDSYHQAHPQGYYGGGPMLYEMDTVAVPTATVQGTTSSAGMGGGPGGAATDSAKRVSNSADFSQTNVQVAGVDESEIVKTDGTNIYFYSDKDHMVYIASVTDPKNPIILKKIKIPDSFTSPELFLSKGKLVLLSTKYDNTDYGYRFWYNRSVKSVVVVYDVSNVTSPKIDRYYETNGTVGQSRVVGDYLYVLSTANFNFPYTAYYGPMVKSATAVIDTNKFNADFDGSQIIPKKTELRRTDVASEQNFTLRGKVMPYNLGAKDAASCQDLEYILPDADTMKSFDFTPNLTTLSIINLANPTAETKTKVLFGDTNEIHMSEKSLYITAHLSTTYDFKCRSGFLCAMPFYGQGQNSLIHKFSVNGNNVAYQNSTVVSGSPLNQYSMDEDASGNFRIVTSTNGVTPSTNVFVLSPSLSVLGKLTNIAPKERFQSARFIGDRLYLVTFQQIDPLFTISLTDPKNPKILGELKIPGYSTYLHPYDATHLIGIGYDTFTNKWGGTQNGGIKVDLYDVSDIANPKQLSTLTLGDQGSSSDVLSNPRLFVWNTDRHLLFMPATLMTNAGDKNDTYRSKDAWQGTVVLKIDTDSGVKEQSRISHVDRSGLDAKRTEDCKQYAQNDGKPVCHALIGGGQYCTSATQTYVPPYCYADSSVGEYFANQIWNYSNDFVIRNLYFGSDLVTLSNNHLQTNDIDNGYVKTGSVELK